MVHKRQDRPKEGYRAWPTLPGFGRVGPWQTGFTQRRQAEQVEAWLHQVALTQPEIIEALIRHDFTLRDAWVAKVRGGDHLDQLLLGRTDPPLAAAVERYRPLCADDRARDGLDQILEYAPDGARLSWLRESPDSHGEKPPRHVSDIYRRAIADNRKPTSVQRSLHRAVRELLLHEFGEEGARIRLQGLKVKQILSAKDTREVHVSGDELLTLLDACGPDFRDMPLLAILLAVDRGPLARITPRFFNERKGTLEVLDQKTTARPRTIELSTPALAVLRRRCSAFESDERIFPWTPGQIRNMWEAARDTAAGRPTRHQRRGGAADPVGEAADLRLQDDGIVTLPILRFKDLRHLLPTAWNALGLPSEDLDGIMGWAQGSPMRSRYTTARIEGDRKSLDRVAGYLGLDKVHLRAVGE